MFRPLFLAMTYILTPMAFLGSRRVDAVHNSWWLPCLDSLHASKLSEEHQSQVRSYFVVPQHLTQRSRDRKAPLIPLEGERDRWDNNFLCSSLILKNMDSLCELLLSRQGFEGEGIGLIHSGWSLMGTSSHMGARWRDRTFGEGKTVSAWGKNPIVDELVSLCISLL